MAGCRLTPASHIPQPTLPPYPTHQHPQPQQSPTPSGLQPHNTMKTEPKEQIAYKLFRLRKDGSLGPLFINKDLVIKPGVWLDAEPHHTPGFAFRPGWHACFHPVAPHLKLNPKGQRRVWCKVLVQDFSKYDRPESQGGAWILANRLKLVGQLDPIQVDIMSVDWFYRDLPIEQRNRIKELRFVNSILSME